MSNPRTKGALRGNPTAGVSFGIKGSQFRRFSGVPISCRTRCGHTNATTPDALIQHVHGGCQQNTRIGPTGKDLGEERLTGSGIPNEDETGAFGEELDIQETQDAGLSSMRLL